MKDLRRRFPVYSRLLMFYPASYRARYGEQILQILADMLDDDPSSLARARVWARTVRDWPVSITAQQLQYARNLFVYETPSFVRHSVVLSGWSFIPFLIIATTNDIDGHHLYHTWLWSREVLFTWIVLLPAAGLLLSAVTFLFWLRKNRYTWRQSLGDVSHTWIMLLPMALGTSILIAVFTRS